MSLDLKEFQEIVDGESILGAVAGKPPSPEEMTRALQALLTRQCIHSSTPSLGRTYEIVRGFAPFFERYFGALGYKLEVHGRDQTVALSVPKDSQRYDAVYERLTKVETIILLSLRLMWEEAVSAQEVGDGGVVETTTGDLIDRIKTVTQTDPPEEGKLLDLLRLFQKHGAIRVGKRDRVEKVSPLAILPGVRILIPDDYVGEILEWAVPAAKDMPAVSAEEVA